MDDSRPDATLVPIGRFARLAGLSVPQLRLYDRRGLLVPAARDRRSGYRYYSEALAVADLNGDGMPDVVVTSLGACARCTSGGVGVLLNTSH